MIAILLIALAIVVAMVIDAIVRATSQPIPMYYFWTPVVYTQRSPALPCGILFLLVITGGLVMLAMELWL